MWVKFWVSSFDIANLVEYSARKKIDFFQKWNTKAKKSKRCDLRKRFKIAQKKIWWCCDKNSRLCFILNWPMQILSVEHFQLQWYQGKKIEPFFFKVNQFFTYIFWLVCRVFTIVLLMQRARFGRPLIYVAHVRTVHRKCSRGSPQNIPSTATVEN